MQDVSEREKLFCSFSLVFFLPQALFNPLTLYSLTIYPLTFFAQSFISEDYEGKGLRTEWWNNEEDGVEGAP